MNQKRSVESTSETSSKRISIFEKSPVEELLAVDAISNQIFSFVPKDRYRFIAAVSKTFQQSYTRATNQIYRTSYEAGLENPQTAAIFIAECNALEPREKYCALAARHGHLETMKYLRDDSIHEDPFPWDDTTCCEAATYGRLTCLQYAHEHGCPWDEDTCAWASRSGSLTCLQYAHEHGCPWDEDTCTWAARSGRLTCLQYAHEHGCRWNEDTCRNAAGSGSLTCLQYAHEHGCPWNAQDCANTAESCRRLDCLHYIRVHGLQLRNL